MKTSKNTIYGISFLINFLLILIVFASFNTGSLRIYYNSDTLYLASIYKDLFVDGTGFKGWHLNAAPNFFPDMSLYFIINSIFNDFRTAYLVFSFVQYFLILFLLNALLKAINPNIKIDYLILLNLFFPVFLSVTFISHNFLYTYFLFSHSFHSGMFINALAAFIFFFKYFNSNRKVYLYLLALISLIGIYNDRLFLVIVSMPFAFIFVLNFFFFKNRRIKLSGIAIISASIAALILFKYTKTNSVFHCIGLDQKYMNFGNVIFSFNKLFSQHYNYIKDLRLQGFISIIAIFNIIFLPVLIVKKYKIKSFDTQNNLKQIEIVFFSLMFFSIVITLFSPALNGYYLGEALLRYNIYSFYLSVFNLVVFLYLVFREKVRYVNIFSFILFALYGGIILKNFSEKDVIKKVAEVASFYPEKVKSTDEFAAKNNLKYGLAQYWDAKYITLFSKENIRVYTVIDENLNPWFHVMNKNWYFDYEKGKYNKPVFDFIVTDKYNTDKLNENFGPFTDTLIFDDEIFAVKLKYPVKFDRKNNKAYSLKN